MDHLAILAIRRDKGGIVASVTKVLEEFRCSIENSQMALQGDHFSMVLVVAGQDVDRDRLRARLKQESDSEDIVVTDVADFDTTAPTAASHLVTVYCPERIGVISALSGVLHRYEVNITHLHSRVHELHKERYCVVRAYVWLPGELASTKLREELEEVIAVKDKLTAVKVDQLTGDSQSQAS